MEDQHAMVFTIGVHSNEQLDIFSDGSHIERSDISLHDNGWVPQNCTCT